MAVLTGGMKTYKSMTKEELIQELIMKSNQLEEMEKKSIQDQVGLRRLATMVRDSNDAITIQDLDGTITEWNRGAERMYGYSETEALGMNILDIVPDRSKEEAVGLIQQIKTGRPIDSLETKRVTKDKRILDVWLTITKLTDDNGRVTAVATTERDITERKQMEHKLKLVSMTDDMTGLYNRRGFRLLAEKLLLQAERNNNRLLLLYCDLDNLKVINDRFGHREGDQAIMDFVDILKNTFRKADIIARLGGDEFTVLVTGVKNLWSEQIIIKNLKEKISGHNEQERRSHPLEVSIGASYFNPVHPCTIDEFINRADNAMYKEKKKK